MRVCLRMCNMMCCGLGRQSDENKSCLLSNTQQPTLINSSPFASLSHTAHRPAAVFPPVDPPDPGALHSALASKQAHEEPEKSSVLNNAQPARQN